MFKAHLKRHLLDPGHVYKTPEGEEGGDKDLHAELARRRTAICEAKEGGELVHL